MSLLAKIALLGTERSTKEVLLARKLSATSPPCTISRNIPVGTLLQANDIFFMDCSQDDSSTLPNSMQDVKGELSSSLLAQPDPLISRTHDRTVSPEAGGGRDFSGLHRMNSSSYRELEVLLQAHYLNHPDISLEEEDSFSISQELSEITQQEATHVAMHREQPLVLPVLKGNFSSDGVTFRFNSDGDAFVASDGGLVRSSKNMALYYDMILEGEAMNTRDMNSLARRLNAVDMFHGKRTLSEEEIQQILSSGQSPKDVKLQKKEKVIRENHDFVEALVRVRQVCAPNPAKKKASDSLDLKMRRMNSEVKPSIRPVTGTSR
jgi:hypothetical protein